MDEVRLIDANNLKFVLKLGVEQGIIKTLHDVEDFIDEMTVYDKETLYPRWKNPNTELPKVETEVLILYCNGTGHGITTAFYEDGTVLHHESSFILKTLRTMEYTTKIKMSTESRKAGGNSAITAR